MLKRNNYFIPVIRSKVKTLSSGSSNWDGTWGASPHSGKFADPKKYTIKANAYMDASQTQLIDSENVDVYLVRLGVTSIKFGGAGHVNLQFHQDTEANKDTDTAHLFAYSTPWVLRDLGQSGSNADICNGSDKGKPRSVPGLYTERFYPLEGSAGIFI